MKNTASGLSKLWDGKPVDRVRSGDGSAKLYGRRVSFHLMAQPEILQPILSNRLLLSQGLLSRSLVTWPDTLMGSRTYVECDLSQFPEMARYKAVMLYALQTPQPMAECSQNELKPRLLHLAPAAKTLWIKFHNAVERELGDGGKLGPIRGLGSKAAQHSARIAGVLALVEDLHAPSIGTTHLEMAIELVSHYLDEALRLYQAGSQDPDLTLAQILLVWLKSKGKE
jgi:putative DNA primase/helicase